MKVKEVDKTANAAWSPAGQQDIYLAAGTVGGQVDETFSTAATLDIFSVDLENDPSSTTLPLVGSISSEQRFYKLLWSPFGKSNGVLVGGGDLGKMMIYDVKSVFNGEDGLRFSSDKHTGPVRALDFNPFKEYLLISGASDSELYIWDLNDTSFQMSPGETAQPLETVTCVAWNRQVSHILMSSFSSKILIWDLRKSESIIKVQDSSMRMCCKSVAWHPDIATQLCVASEDDHYPVIQIWDLRFATSPLKTLAKHQKGILSVSWCSQDPELLLSCGKDNKIICWNPESNLEGGEVLCEIPTGNEWSFEVSWCPRNPLLIQSSSYDGKISIHSLMDNHHKDEFESFSTGEVNYQSTSQNSNSYSYLAKPPVWMKSAMRASIGFGGKLVTMNGSGNHPNEDTHGKKIITISQVITETNLLMRAGALEQTILSGNLKEFCDMKIESCDKSDILCWQALKAKLNPEFGSLILDSIGYKPDVMPSNLVDEATREPSLSVNKNPEESKSFAHVDDELKACSFVIPKISEGIDGDIAHAIITGNLNSAVEKCLDSGKMADAIILAMSGGPDLMDKVQKCYYKKSQDHLSKLIYSVATGNWDSFIQNCSLTGWKEALACILTYARPNFNSLCDKFGKRLAEAGKKQEAILFSICSENINHLVEALQLEGESGTTKTNPIEKLMDDVDLTLLMKAALECHGYSFQIDDGPTANLLIEYSSLLTAQGKLETALNYLNCLKNGANSELKDRLTGALQPSTRTRTISKSDKGAGNRMKNIYSAVQPDNHPSDVGLTSNMKLYSPMEHTNTREYLQPVPNDIPPAGPKKVTKKYVADPSVYQTPSYMSDLSNPHLRISTAVPPANIPPLKQVNLMGDQPYNQFMPRMEYYNEATTFNPVPTPDVVPPNLRNPVASVNANVMDPPGVSIMTPIPQSTSRLVHSASPGMFSSSPMSHTNDKIYQAPPPPPHFHDPSTNMRAGAASGWNDPPVLSKFQSRKGSGAGAIELSNPITQPLGNVAYDLPNSVTPVYSDSSTLRYVNFDQQQNNIPYNEPPPPPPTHVPNNMDTMQHSQQVQPEKPEILSEFATMHYVFHTLTTKCLGSSHSNLMLKKKVGDCEKKLENLYDKLRGLSPISAKTVECLSDITNLISTGNYPEALESCGLMISKGALSEVSTFMPGVKSLIQCASQMGVYL